MNITNEDALGHIQHPLGEVLEGLLKGRENKAGYELGRFLARARVMGKEVRDLEKGIDLIRQSIPDREAYEKFNNSFYKGSLTGALEGLKDAPSE